MRDDDTDTRITVDCHPYSTDGCREQLRALDGMREIVLHRLLVLTANERANLMAAEEKTEKHGKRVDRHAIEC